MQLQRSSKNNPYIAWFVATSFVFFQFFLQTSSSLMNELWMKDFNINTLQVSNLSAAFFYTYVLMQIPVGLLYDRFSVKKILIIAAVTLALGCFILSITHSYSMAVAARFLMGIGSSFGYIGMLKVVLNNFTPNRFALMLGIGETIAMTIVTLGVIILGLFLKLHSWRIAMFICAILAIAIVAAITFYMQEYSKPKGTQVQQSFSAIIRQVKSLIFNKQVILNSMYGFFLFAIVNAFTSLWGVSFITNTTNFSHEIAANMVSVVFVGLGIGAPLIGLLSKKLHNNTQIMFYCAIVMSITTLIIVFITGLSKPAWFVLLFISGLCCAGYVPGLAVIKDSVSPEIQATSLAASNMIIMSSAPILQLLIGSLLHSNILSLSPAGNYRFALAVIPLGMITAVILCRFIKEPTKRVIVTELN